MITNKRGFTLMEVLIVLIIIVTLAFIGTGLISSSFRTKSREVSWRMSSTVKYLYNSSISENKTIRLVFDFENNSYSAEATTDKFLLDKGDDKDKKSGSPKKEEPEKKAPETETIATPDNADELLAEKSKEEETNEPEPLKPAEATFGAIETPFMATKQLPSGLLLKDIYTGHDKEPVTAGKAYIYFFQNGYVEPAIINLKDEADEKHISIKINPFSGDTDIQPEYRKLEEK